MTLFRNASDFIPLTMIPLTELAVGNASGHANLFRWNQNQNSFNAMGKAAVNAPQSRRSARVADPGEREASGVRVALAPLSDGTLLSEQ